MIPLKGLGWVSGNALAVLIKRGQIILRWAIMHQSRCAVILKCKSVILREEFAFFIEVTQVELRLRFILGSGSAEPLDTRLNLAGRGVMGKNLCGKQVLSRPCLPLGRASPTSLRRARDTPAVPKDSSCCARKTRRRRTRPWKGSTRAGSAPGPHRR